MKKIMTTAVSLMMLLSCAACGNDSSKPAESSSAETSATTTELTTTELTTTELTTTELTTTSSAVQEETTVSKSTGTEAGKNEMGKLTQALYDRIRNYKDGQVRMKMQQQTEETGNQTVELDVVVADEKLRFVMKISNLFSINMIKDGSKTYLLDEENKQYAAIDDMSDSPIDTDDTPLLSEDGLGKYIGTGKKQFKGIQRTYEEYLSKDDDDDKEQKVRYYYDESGDLIGISNVTGTGEEEMEISVRFEKQVDESLFRMPAGYQEGKAEVVAQNVYGKMFAMLLGGLEDLTGSLGSTPNGGSGSGTASKNKKN